MSPLTIAQFMAAAAFFSVAVTHLFVWFPSRKARPHLFFALTCLAAGGIAIFESTFYRSENVEAFNEAFRWNNSLGIVWAIALLWFLIEFTGGGGIRRGLGLGLTVILLLALAINVTSPFGLLYAEITELRQIGLPWGEDIALAEGQESSWHVLTDAALLGLILFAVEGCVRLWRRSQGGRAAVLGLSILFFVMTFAVHGRLVDTGRLNLPYLNTYAYLVVVFAMNHVLAGEVVKASRLSREITANERRWRSLLENVRVFVLGLDRDGRINHVNPYFEEVSGYRTAEIVGELFERFLPKDIRPRFRHRFSDLLAGTPHPEVESALRTKDGRTRIVLWANVILRDSRSEIAGSLSLGTDITELRRKEADLRTAVAEERSRIASDLHDSVTQTLFSTAAIADALPDVWERYPEEARRGLNDLRQLTKGALAETRALLLELRPAALLEKSLGELLVQLADATVGRTRIPVTTKITHDTALPESVQIGLYRVAQEALNNVIKHAQASQATLGLGGDAQRVILTIRDDGRGFSPQSVEPGRLGLAIMQERARAIGGSLTVESAIGEGATIEVTWIDTPDRDSDE